MSELKRIFSKISILHGVLVTLFSVALHQPLLAQTVMDSFSAQPQPVGARGAALGNAIVADIATIENMYLNPSSLLFVRESSLFLNNRQEWTNHVFEENITVPIFATRTQALAVGASVSHAGYIKPQFRLRFLQIGTDIGYSLSIVGAFSAGLLVSVRRGQVESSAVTTGWLTLGLMYSPTPAISYAVAFRGIGKGIDYSYDEANAKSVVRQADDLPKIMEVGATMSYPATGSKSIFSLSLSGERRFEEGVIRYKGGIEVLPWNFLRLRIGHIGRIREFRFGAGISIEGFTLDYAISPNNEIGRFDEVSLSLVL